MCYCVIYQVVTDVFNGQGAYIFGQSNPDEMSHLWFVEIVWKGLGYERTHCYMVLQSHLMNTQSDNYIMRLILF